MAHYVERVNMGTPLSSKLYPFFQSPAKNCHFRFLSSHFEIVVFHDILNFPNFKILRKSLISDRMSHLSLRTPSFFFELLCGPPCRRYARPMREIQRPSEGRRQRGEQKESGTNIEVRHGRRCRCPLDENSASYRNSVSLKFATQIFSS